MATTHDHASELEQLRKAVTGLFDHVQAWNKAAEEKKQAAEGLRELKDKAEALLVLIEKADRGLTAISHASEAIVSANMETGRRFDVMETVHNEIAAKLAAGNSANQAIMAERFDAIETMARDGMVKLRDAASGSQAKILTVLLVANLVLSLWSLLR